MNATQAVAIFSGNNIHDLRATGATDWLNVAPTSPRCRRSSVTHLHGPLRGTYAPHRAAWTT